MRRPPILPPTARPARAECPSALRPRRQPTQPQGIRTCAPTSWRLLLWWLWEVLEAPGSPLQLPCAPGSFSPVRSPGDWSAGPVTRVCLPCALDLGVRLPPVGELPEGSLRPHPSPSASSTMLGCMSERDQLFYQELEVGVGHPRTSQPGAHVGMGWPQRTIYFKSTVIQVWGSRSTVPAGGWPSRGSMYQQSSKAKVGSRWMPTKEYLHEASQHDTPLASSCLRQDHVARGRWDPGRPEGCGHAGVGRGFSPKLMCAL